MDNRPIFGQIAENRPKSCPKKHQGLVNFPWVPLLHMGAEVTNPIAPLNLLKYPLFLKILCKIEDLFLTLQPIKRIDETGIIPSYLHRTGTDNRLYEAGPQ
jgi:hypothetical protein